MKRRRLSAVVGAGAALAVAGGALAAAIAGVQLSPTFRLDGRELALASCGVRDTLWIDHYVAGLYVPRGTRAERAVRDPATSKILVVRILNAGHFPERLPQKWREPLQSALPADKFAQVSAAYARLRQGDTMMYVYSPDTGLAIIVNGETVIRAGHDVIDALLQAWQRGADTETLDTLLEGHDC